MTDIAFCRASAPPPIPSSPSPSPGLPRRPALCVRLQEFACNGCVVEHPEYGEIIQLQGDQRNNVCAFLTMAKLADEAQLKVHGF